MRNGLSELADSPVCERYVGNGSERRGRNPELVSVTFEPGVIGMFQKDGTVLEVDKVGQAQRAGVQAGWKLHMIMDRRCHSFDDTLFLQARDGNSPYKVTFAKACNVNTEDFVEAAGLPKLLQRGENRNNWLTDGTENNEALVAQKSDIKPSEKFTIAPEGDAERSAERDLCANSNGKPCATKILLRCLEAWQSAELSFLEGLDIVKITFVPGRIGMECRDGAVLKVFEGGQAQKGGVQAGWRIIEVRDRNCKSFMQLADAKKGNAPYFITFAKASRTTWREFHDCENSDEEEIHNDWTIL